MNKKLEDKILPPVANHRPVFLISVTGVGFLFGFVLEKSKVYDPTIIQDQMVFRRFIMIKMFFSALAASTLMVFIYRSRFPAAYSKIYELIRDQIKQRSIFTLVAGGLILGFGMAVAGSCPGMIFVQLGAGVSYAYVTFLGGVFGAFIHGKFHDALNGVSRPSPKSSLTIYEWLNLKPTSLHLGFGAALLTVASLVELIFPWRNDFKIDPYQSSFSIYSKIWSPIFAGCLLGSLQLLSFALLKRPLGNSPPFTIFASHFVSKLELDKNAYLKKWRFGNWDRVAMAVGVLAGSYLSASLGGVYGQTKGNSLVSSFIGGTMLVFGARLADGCNTGHGISGTANLFMGASIATISMFAGAIGLSLFLHL